MQVCHLDHLVLTVADIDASADFYQRVMGMRLETFAGGRKALVFGQQKINLHRHGQEFEPKAGHVMPGSADLCFILSTPLAQAIAELNKLGVIIEDGPIQRTGATGPILSVYFRDPDQNLIEIANPL